MNVTSSVPVKCVLMLIALVMVATGSLRAVSTTYSQAFNGAANGSQNLTFNQFDPSLGNLTGVTLYLSASKLGGWLSVDNDDYFETWTITLRHMLQLSLSSADVSLTKADLNQVGSLFLGSETQISLSESSGDSMEVFNETEAGDYYEYGAAIRAGSVSGAIGSDFWNTGAKGYRGTGTFSISLTANQFPEILNGEVIHYDFHNSNAPGTLNLVYSYTPSLGLPEPSVLLLALGGLALTLGARRRRRG